MKSTKTCRSISILVGLILGGTILFAVGSAAQQTDVGFDVPPWYQIEMVIFTQKANYGGEKPPRTYSLSFPTNWVVLIDPNAPPILDESTLDLPPPASGEDEDALADVIQQMQEETQQPEPGETGIKLEAPFVILSPNLRDLNESAAALDRRETYDVVLHAAWRQPLLGEENDPWVIIKAGSAFGERFQVEGSVRVTRSRFVHFQSDLWLLDFDRSSSIENVDGSTESRLRFESMDANRAGQRGAQMIELPEFPRKERPQDVPIEPGVLNAATTQGGDSEASPETAPAQTAAGGVIAMETPAPETSGDNVALAPVPESANPEAQGEIAPHTLYPVNSVWMFRQSRRLEEDKVNYLDHPQMGILIQIKSYVPEVVNPEVLDTSPAAKPTVTE